MLGCYEVEVLMISLKEEDCGGIPLLASVNNCKMFRIMFRTVLPCVDKKMEEVSDIVSSIDWLLLSLPKQLSWNNEWFQGPSLFLSVLPCLFQ